METTTLKDTAEQALIGLIQSAADAMTFLKGEIPIAVQELLTYYTALYSLYCVAAIGLVTISSIYARKLWRMEDWDVSDKTFVISLPLLPIGLFAAWLGSYVIDLLKITLAPRIWLIEYAASLVK